MFDMPLKKPNPIKPNLSDQAEYWIETFEICNCVQTNNH